MYLHIISEGYTFMNTQPYEWQTILSTLRMLFTMCLFHFMYSFHNVYISHYVYFLQCVHFTLRYIFHVYISGPCERKYCAFGGECTVDEVSGEAQCHCIEDCPDVFMPICGTDNVTYASECRLNIASCTQQRRIKTRSQGSCGK